MAQQEDVHAKMTSWYDPIRLLAIGIRVSSSTMFGRMFDRRELIAALDPFDTADFQQHFNFSDPKFRSEDGAFWLDFCADTGDGWNSTYAVARLLAKSGIPLAGETLLQGRVLVFGGDLVYPTASRDEYKVRLHGPFDAANRQEAGDWLLKDRHIFALPGNHDWYDGLSAFAFMFCSRRPAHHGAAAAPGRTVCGRATHQTRSYFAIKLPGNWWLCAFDAQFDGFVDQVQLSFFEYVSQNLMDEGSDIILCVGQPVWAYSQTETVDAFSNYAFASRIVTGDLSGKSGRKHNLRLVLTGDAHHYAHFTERGETDGPVVHYLTCGLGGAFLHPTQFLRTTHVDVPWRAPPPLKQTKSASTPAARPIYTRTFEKGLVYPDADTSRSLAWRNLGFGWINLFFSFFIAGVALFSTWLLHFSSLVLERSLIQVINTNPLGRTICDLGLVLLTTPWPLLVIGGIFGALYYLADTKDWKKRAALGGTHALLHLLSYFAALIVIGRLLGPGSNDAWLIVLVAVAAFFIQPLILGAYFLISVNYLNCHWNESFSSLRIENYKGFLRMKIDADGKLTVYPIVLDTVPKDDKAALSPKLAETKIEIPAS